MPPPERVGRYEILQRVARGGMGVLYRARDTVLDREVAIKVMAGGFADDDQAHALFYREARAAARLQHPNIVSIFEFGEHFGADGAPYIVMEFLRGSDLERRMLTPPPLTVGEKLGVIAQLCAGLEYAHRQGVIHRDVKPSNIWLLEDGAVKLLDFGIAKIHTMALTRDVNQRFGSASYMAPEYASGDNVDGRADIFSAGVVLYELLSGRKPFEAATAEAVIVRILSPHPAPPMEDLVPGLPPPLYAVVSRALAKEPASRFQSAAELGAELQRLRHAVDRGDDVRRPARYPEDPPLVSHPNELLPAEHGWVAPSQGPPLDVVLPATADGERRRLWPLLVGVLFVAVAGAAGANLALNRYWNGLPRFMSPDVSRDGTETPRAPDTYTQAFQGAYPFAIVNEEGATLSDSNTAHRLTLASPLTVRLRAPDHFLDEAVRIEPSMASRAVEAPRLGWLTIERPGAGSSACEVSIDGRAVGRLPISQRPIARGAHLLEARCPGALPFQQRVEILGDQTVQVVIGRASPAPPPPPPSEIVIAGDYEFAVLDERGNVVSPANRQHTLRVARLRTVSLRSPDYLLDTEVTVDPRNVEPVRAPSLGTLQVFSTRNDCPIFVQRANSGLSPASLGLPPIGPTEVAPGTYEIRQACQDGESPPRETVRVMSQQLRTVRLRSLVAIALVGDYAFEVVGEQGRVVSASARRHEIRISEPQRLRVRADEYFLDDVITVEPTSDTIEVPSLGALTIFSTRGDCDVLIEDRNLGKPPIRSLRVAPGTYTVRQVCESGVAPTGLSVTVRPGAAQTVRMGVRDEPG